MDINDDGPPALNNGKKKGGHFEGGARENENPYRKQGTFETGFTKEQKKKLQYKPLFM